MNLGDKEKGLLSARPVSVPSALAEYPSLCLPSREAAWQQSAPAVCKVSREEAGC